MLEKDSIEVKIARLEERMGMVISEQRDIRKTLDSGFTNLGGKLDTLTAKHWHLSGKQIGVNASISLIVSAITVMTIYIVGR